MRLWYSGCEATCRPCCPWRLRWILLPRHRPVGRRPPRIRLRALEEFGFKDEDGKWHMPIQAKGEALYRYFDYIDWNKGLKNLVTRNLNDAAYGQLGKLNAKASKRLGLGAATPGTVMRRNPGNDVGVRQPDPLGDLVDALWPSL